MNYPVDQVRQSIATHNVVSPVGVEIVAERTGSYRGEAVRSTPENSRLSQAAKAVRPGGLQRTDFRTLQTRQLRQGQGAHPRALARIADYHDKLPNMPDEARMLALVDSFQSLGEMMNHAQAVTQHRPHTAESREERATQRRDRPDAAEEEDGTNPEAPNAAASVRMVEGQVFRLLQEFDADVSHQYAALDILREQFAATGTNPEFEAILEKAFAEFERGDLGRDVRAGFAAAGVAQQSAATLETDPAAIRDAYRSLLRDQPNLGLLFDKLAQFDLGRNFDAAIETFLAAAAADLRSTGPSTDSRFLHGLLTELGKLKKMRTILQGTQDLIRVTERLLPKEQRGQIDLIRVTSDMLHFCGKPTTGVQDARILVAALPDGTPHGLTVFANGLWTLHRQIPDEVMPTGQARLQQDESMRSLLDQLVAQEEAAFEGSVQ